MKNLIFQTLDNPAELEKMYHQNPTGFSSAIYEALLEQPDSLVLQVWSERLNYQDSKFHLQENTSYTKSRKNIFILLALCCVGAILAILPEWVMVSGSWYNSRFNAVAVIFPIILYFLFTQYQLKTMNVALIAMTCYVLYLFYLPSNFSPSVKMALLHLPFLGLSILAMSFLSSKWRDSQARLAFIHYLGEMLICSVMILLGGVVLSLLTLGLLSSTSLNLNWYLDYVVVSGTILSPLVGTYFYDVLLKRNSNFASPLANVFAPLFFVSVSGYLIVCALFRENPYSGRDTLITLNGLLLVILAVTVFSISGRNDANKVLFIDIANVGLLVVTFFVNLIALTAIVYRWNEYGFTYNRMVVTGANLTIFIHLCLLLWNYLGFLIKKTSKLKLEKVITRYLPVYTLWSCVVVFVLPLVFKYQ